MQTKENVVELNHEKVIGMFARSLKAYTNMASCTRELAEHFPESEKVLTKRLNHLTAMQGKIAKSCFDFCESWGKKEMLATHITNAAYYIQEAEKDSIEQQRLLKSLDSANEMRYRLLEAVFEEES